MPQVAPQKSAQQLDIASEVTPEYFCHLAQQRLTGRFNGIQSRHEVPQIQVELDPHTAFYLTHEKHAGVKMGPAERPGAIVDRELDATIVIHPEELQCSQVFPPRVCCDIVKQDR